MPTVTALGALIALIVAIFLILKKVSPAYGMLVGALVGGISRWCGFISNCESHDRRSSRYHYRSHADSRGRGISWSAD